MNKIFTALRNPKATFIMLFSTKYTKFLKDEIFLHKKFFLIMGKKLDLKNPKTYNEKLQWLKLYDRKPEYTTMVDKYEVRRYIANTIGEEYLIPLIGVWDKFDDIDFDKLPNQFVIKCTHDSGGVVICENKSELDIDLVRKKINKCLKRNYYYAHREWPYKNAKPRIIVEHYMVDESGNELKDYKFFCFNGEPKALHVITGRRVYDTRLDCFDMEFNHIPLSQEYKNAIKHIEKPSGFKEMIRLANILTRDIPHVRVDFYDINGQVYFGELTFHPFSGFEKIEPEEYDELFGSWLNLPENKLINH